MVTHVVLGIRLSPNSFQRVKIDDFSLDNKVDQLKLEASKTTNLPKSVLELIYCGHILDDEATLRSCGLKSGVMVHVLKKKEIDVPAPVRTMTEADIMELVMAFHRFPQHPNYRSSLQRLTQPEVIENIIMATPGLSEDPVAMSIIQDPDLMIHMENDDTVRRIAESHPSLVEAANYIAAAVQKDFTTRSSSHQGPSTGYSYSLEALSDEEEMDSSQSSDSQPHGGESSSQQSYSTITSAQLAAALMGTTGMFPSPQRGGSSSGTGGSGPITSEMFSEAMQQAIANVTTSSRDTPPTGGTASPSAETEPSNNLEAMARHLTRQLQQMRELGLTDDTLNMQALEATGGDVHAAIDLVFSGAIPSNNP